MCLRSAGLIGLALLLASCQPPPSTVPPTATPEVSPELTPEPTPELTPEPTPELTPEPTPELTPEPTPEPTEEGEDTPEPTEEGEDTPEPTEEGEDTPEPTEEGEDTPEPTQEGEDTPVDPPDRPDAAYYDPDHLVEVEVWMDPDDWETLRHQQRYFFDLIKGEDCLAAPREDPYTWFEADVVIDGQPLDTVGIRKKGFYGSASTTKPGLKLEFDEYVKGQELDGMERMTLNNGTQDPSLIHQCMAYQVFAAAGAPAPRCNFARVTVNGDYLGVYVHVEPLKKDFLRWNFPDDDGDLYEGAISDFRDGWTGTFEAKTEDTDEAYGPILALTEALKVDDRQLLATVGAQVDIDAFLTYWALEVLVAQWDGFTSNGNNFYVYREPDSGLMYFVPWGIDGSMSMQVFGRDTPASVYATTILPWRLYQIPSIQAQYVDRLGALLDSVWDEDALVAETERMEALLLPHTLEPEEMVEGIAVVQDFIRERRSYLEPELEEGGVEWEEELRDSPCWPYRGTVELEFETTWDTLGAEDLFGTGESDLVYTWEEQSFGPYEGGATAGYDDDLALIDLNVKVERTDFYHSYLLFPQSWARSGEYTLDGKVAYGWLEYNDTRSGRNVPIGIFVDGPLTFTELEAVPGGKVKGSCAADLYGAF